MPAVGYRAGYVEETIVSSTARTANGDSGVLSGWGSCNAIRFQVTVTAASGTNPKLKVFVDDTLDGTNWNERRELGEITGTGIAGASLVEDLGSYSYLTADRIRVRWEITGTSPSFTFSVIAASRADGA